MTALEQPTARPRLYVPPVDEKKPERSVEEMLREIAYVLHVTRRVRTEILAARTPTNALPAHRLAA